MSCDLHQNINLPYLEFHADEERRVAQGEKQRECPKCGRWIWESLYYEKEKEA